VGPVSLYCRGLGGECEDGYGTLRGESGSTCDITILFVATPGQVVGLSDGQQVEQFTTTPAEGAGELAVRPARSRCTGQDRMVKTGSRGRSAPPQLAPPRGLLARLSYDLMGNKAMAHLVEQSCKLVPRSYCTGVATSCSI